MEWIDFVVGFVSGVLIATLFWGRRHARFEERLARILLDHFTDEERAAIVDGMEEDDRK